MFQTSHLIAELNSYREEFERTNTASADLDSIVGDSQKLFKEMVLRIAGSPSTVLITGESGTGKELYAQAVHYYSDRSNFPFVKVNCAAIPENLLESELFGYADGAFTGARKGGKMGKFELADKGTIFLDEVGDMPRAMQAKLLRVLQEREFERIGDTKPTRVNVRIISATNTNLPAKVDAGKFRHDLFYRLNVVHFHIPPLKERKQDIVPIAEHIIKKLNPKLKQNVIGISSASKELLLNYDWPGNVRELGNVLETAMNFCQSSYIMPHDLPLFFHQQVSQLHESQLNLQAALDRIEKQTIIQALNAAGNNRGQASSHLGISRTTLYRLMKKHGLLDG
ncbi:MAG TPA: sigma 54-interacting transcriptional regulator [Syntrophomonadaceae bacterium]|nr:sigma 54-interacting transcriptional regulator [Syntrophomonadaceae bacterium]HPR93549.1 sigma 54-interacting transcriptional regulator [Syntrophomonadaceae bacterium]